MPKRLLPPSTRPGFLAQRLKVRKRVCFAKGSNLGLVLLLPLERGPRHVLFLDAAHDLVHHGALASRLLLRLPHQALRVGGAGGGWAG